MQKGRLTPEERKELISRAIKVGYKPRLPTNSKSQLGEQGFSKRLGNWINGLEHRERAYSMDSGTYKHETEGEMAQSIRELQEAYGQELQAEEA